VLINLIIFIVDCQLFLSFDDKISFLEKIKYNKRNFAIPQWVSIIFQILII
jgi:hypothetical protein